MLNFRLRRVWVLKISKLKGGNSKYSFNTTPFAAPFAQPWISLRKMWSYIQGLLSIKGSAERRVLGRVHITRCDLSTQSYARHLLLYLWIIYTHSNTEGVILFIYGHTLEFNLFPNSCWKNILKN